MIRLRGWLTAKRRNCCNWTKEKKTNIKFLGESKMKRLSVVLILLAMVSVEQIPTSKTAEPEKSYLASMSAGGTSGIDSFPEPNSYPDLNSDDIVNFVDFAIFAENWQQSGSGLDGDFDNSGTVDTNDLTTFAFFWLNGPHPLDVFESFKNALLADDVNEAVTFFTEISTENYRPFLEQLSPYFTQMVNDMGELIFIRFDNDMVVYDLLRQEDGQTYGYPVIFIRNEMGQWKIYDF
ncbi:hypothetical protein ES703_71652 [subsurface metagenome]